MNTVTMSQLKYLILLSCISLFPGCGQKGPLVINDTALEIDRAYQNKIKPVPQATQGSTISTTQALKQKELELLNKGYKS